METIRYNRLDVRFEDFSDGVAKVIPDLAIHNDYRKNIDARRYLLDLGKKILPQINMLLESKNIKLRKEASKIIEIFSEKESIPVLIDLLDDDDGSIRWIAAEGLAHIGRECIVPLLRRIVKNGDSTYLRLGARHTLLLLFSEDEKQHFKPLLLSLKNYNNISILAPLEAFRALIMFKHQNIEPLRFKLVHE